MEYIPIKDNINYGISETGKVINLLTKKILKDALHTKGYRNIRIAKKMYYIHRLVAMAFIPNPENLPQINHIDGDKTNNNISNLEWISNKDNWEHALNMGLVNSFGNKEENCVGANNPHSKLTDNNVIEIKKSLLKGISCKNIAKNYNISEGAIFDIKSGRSWKHIK